jgi:glycyl-tRNA synthetase beta chain
MVIPMGRDILLEIGTEEIPARFLPGELRDIKDIALKALDEARIGHGEAESYATPRRLALIVRDVDEMQADETREVFGPPKKAAYDKDGNLTKAAEGFARGQGIDPAKLEVKDKEGKGEYICATVEDIGQAAVEVLPGLLKDCILKLNFPKSMRWSDGTMRYARPVHWVVAIYGAETLEFELEGIKSGNKSRGHRFLAPDDIEITGADEYLLALEGQLVFVDQARRMTMIAEQAGKLAAEVDGKPEFDDEFLSIVACILEYPVAVLCGFETRYLELPDELLTAVMVGHQKYFPVSGKDGKLINNFVIVSNTKAENADTVRMGAERVCRARFEDARFYFEEDRTMKLAERLSGLKAVTFQEKLGSVYDKTQRLMGVAGELAGSICPEKKDSVVRAAELSKTDLITGVVFEFPELQGIMGMYYARHDGEGDEVAQAIREQYLPGFSGDKVPDSDVGAALSLADRADNIASFFSIGLKPTGSVDPFALRRQALGIVSILTEKGYELSIADVMAPALKGNEDVTADLMEFFKLRIENILLDKGYSHDLVQSVLSHAVNASFKDIYARLDSASAFKAHEKYNNLLIGLKRVSNIIPDDLSSGASVDPSLFKEDDEKELYDSFIKIKDCIEAKIKVSDFSGAIEDTTLLTEPINRFFDSVLVMDKDEAIKNNRLRMLSDIALTVSSIVDFSKLQEQGDQE